MKTKTQPKRPRGRPRKPVDAVAGVDINIRTTRATKALLRSAAEARRTTLSAFVLGAAVDKAKGEEWRPRPPHIRRRMTQKIAQQIAALPDGRWWRLDERLAMLIGRNVRVAAREIAVELQWSRRSAGVAVVFHQIFVGDELRPVAEFGKLNRYNSEDPLVRPIDRVWPPIAAPSS